jgi:hypothetical protein
MSTLRAVYVDLIDKRLWPLAVGLALALVAIPVLLSKPAPPVEPPVSTLAAKPGPMLADPASQVTPSGGPVPGNAKNPFRQRHVPKPMTSSPAAIGPAPASSGGEPTTSAGSGGGSTTSGGPTGSPPVGSGGAPPRPAPSVVRLRVKFGTSSGRRTTRDLVDGSPLPTSDNPLLVYLGIKAGKPTFLVSSDAQPRGDGTCLPNKAICSELRLDPGETEFFDVTGPGGTVQYQLDVVRVVRR